MKKKNSFEKKYPLFSKYFTDVNIQNNMLDNTDLAHKYTTYNHLIRMFVNEIDSHFDIETVKKMIIESIVKLPDEMLVALIKAYLASKEVAKANMDFIKYFKMTSNFGRESLDYIVDNGLITNRKYRDIPYLAIDYHYDKVKTGEEEFKGIHLENIYSNLEYPQKSFVINLIEGKAFSSLNAIFKNFNLNFISLIKILMSKGIDSSILNKDAILELGEYPMMLLVCLLIEIDDPFENIQVLKKMLIDKRYELIKEIITNNYVNVLANINYDNIIQMSDDGVIKLLSTKKLILAKECA